MANRNTQIVLEVLIEGSPSVRSTQAVLEVGVVPPIPNLRVTQMVMEVGITRPTGEECSFPWTMPQPNRYPRWEDGGPMYATFRELEPDWREFGQIMGDGVPDYGTYAAGPIRRFAYTYDGLSEAEADFLDAHHASTRGKIPFEWVHPETGVTYPVARYESYDAPTHEKVWLKVRAAVLIVFPV